MSSCAAPHPGRLHSGCSGWIAARPLRPHLQQDPQPPAGHRRLGRHANLTMHGSESSVSSLPARTHSHMNACCSACIPQRGLAAVPAGKRACSHAHHACSCRRRPGDVALLALSHSQHAHTRTPSPPATCLPARGAGAGSFGRVSLARHIASGRTVAIKAMSKAAIIRENQVQHTLDERAMLSKVSGYPFLINMLATFQVRQRRCTRQTGRTARHRQRWRGAWAGFSRQQGKVWGGINTGDAPYPNLCAARAALLLRRPTPRCHARPITRSQRRPTRAARSALPAALRAHTCASSFN